MEKFVLVTGSTGGLGKEFCKVLASNNENLLLTGTNINRLQDLKKELKEQYENLNIEICECDLSKESSRKELFDFIENNQISIKMLINNAGFITEGSIMNATSDNLINCIRVNCEGVIDVTKFVLDRKVVSDNLDIITISSMAGDYPMPYMAIYASTKSFLTNFMSALRIEYSKQNVRVLVVKPGAIPTSQEMKDAIKAQGFKGRLSSVGADVIAKNSLKKIGKAKSYVPGFFNKITVFFSKFVTKNFQAKVVAKMWKKSQEKRNIK